MINSQLLKRHTFIVCTNSKTSWILHANVCRSAKTELSQRESIRGDCNFTHGVTHWSVTLRLSAYALQCENPRLYSFIPLRRSNTPVVYFVVVRWMYECNYMLWNIYFCSSLFLFLLFFFSICFLLLIFVLWSWATIFYISWQTEPIM